MKMMDIIYKNTPQNIDLAAQKIKKGELVAFPTETVYGLGANVYNAKAVAKIFAAKHRPKFDPLISHIADVEFLREYAATDERVFALAKRFWPGPLTFVLSRIDNLKSIDLACSGLSTITVRMPNHPVALELIQKSGCPIVAPSANTFQSISPTLALHVYDDLCNKEWYDPKIGPSMIIDGGKCKVGVESTIIDLTSPQVVILRAGGTPKEDLEEFLGEKIIVSSGNPELPTAPGQVLRHYAPKHSLRINIAQPDDDEFFIGFGSVDGDINLSPDGDLLEAATNLFAYMHIADEQTVYQNIAVAPIPMFGLGLAINDRLKRASYLKERF